MLRWYILQVNMILTGINKPFCYLRSSSPELQVFVHPLNNDILLLYLKQNTLLIARPTAFPA